MKTSTECIAFFVHLNTHYVEFSILKTGIFFLICLYRHHIDNLFLYTVYIFLMLSLYSSISQCTISNVVIFVQNILFTFIQIHVLYVSDFYIIYIIMLHFSMCTAYFLHLLINYLYCTVYCVPILYRIYIF